MGTTSFLLLCLLFALAAYAVMRSFVRSRMTYSQLLDLAVPVDDQAPMPASWGRVCHLMTLRKNSAIFTAAADRYRRIIPACLDVEAADEMDLTYRTFLENHAKLTKSIVLTFGMFCLNKVVTARCTTCVENVTRYYANEILLLREMSVVMDGPIATFLEGTFLPYGTG